MPGKELFEIVGISPLLLAILLAFWKGDDAISEELRSDISDAINETAKKTDRRVFLAALEAQFKRVFSDSHLSWSCLSRSTLASFFFLAVIGLALGILYGASVPFYIAVFIVAAIPNSIGDYISLGETRYVLRLVRQKKISPLGGVLVDSILTMIIFYITLIALSSNETIFLWLNDITPSTTEFGIAKDALLLGREVHLAGLVLLAPLLTTYLTSVWVWSAAIGVLLLRVIPVLSYSLPVDSKPIRSIGIAAIIAVIPLWIFGVLAINIVKMLS